MRKTSTNPLILMATAAALTVTLGAAATAGTAGAPATNGRAADSPPQSARVAVEAPTSVETQRGLVLEGSGQINGVSLQVTVYENSLYGNSVQVVLGDPDEGNIGAAEQDAPFVVEGELDATVRIGGRSATLSGTVESTGRTERVVEPVQDGGEQIVTRGTNTALLTDVTLTYDGASVPVEFAPAFAYELQVRKVSLYGR
jgi:hypothetical protein